MDNLLTWNYESHYRGSRTGFHSQKENKAILNFLELDDSRFFKDFQLKPYTRYKASVHCIGTDIEAQSQQGANLSILGQWVYSTEYNFGKGTFEGDLTLSFRTNKTGKIRLSLRLGFWCSEAKGKAEFSNFKLEEDYEWICIGCEQVRFDATNETLSIIDLDKVNRWLQVNNTAYQKMKELYGKAPYDGDPIFIEDREDLNAYAIAGNPIIWNKQCMLRYFLEESDDATFGTIHEIGHDFDQTVLTKMNCEMMANFGLLYAVDNANLSIFFDNEHTKGDGLIHGFYFRAYQRTIAKREYHHDGLEYCLMRIKEAIGWEPFRVVMRKLLENPPKVEKPTEVLALWLDMLTKESGVDVRTTFLPGELEFIMSQPKL